MCADDGRTDAFGVIDDGIAFGAQFVDQPAHAQFIVGVAALKRVDFGVDERLEFGCARNRALDALVHGGDFAPDGLANGHDPLGGDGLGLRQAQRHFGHGTRGVAHVLRTGHHRREGEEEKDRHDDPNDDRDETGHGNEPADRTGRPQLCTI